MQAQPEQLPGLLVVLSGPSGVGKTTVSRALLLRDGYTKSISATTRGARVGERDGVDYHFVGPDRFLELIEADELIEYAQVHDRFYGTPKQPLRDALRKNQVMLLVIDVEGGKLVAGLKLDALLIFVAPPSVEELAKRLDKRETETLAEREKRMARYNMELAAAKAYYDHIVVNDNLNRCVEEVAQHIEARRRQLLARQQAGEALYLGLGQLNEAAG